MSTRASGVARKTMDLRDCEDTIRRGLKTLERHSRFVDVLAEQRGGWSVSLDSRSVTPAYSTRFRGVVYRAWGNGHWVEAATSGCDEPSVASGVEELLRTLAKEGTDGVPPGTASTAVREWVDRPSHPIEELGTAGAIALAREIHRSAKAVEGVRECQVQLTASEDDRLYLNTLGARTYRRFERVRGNLAAIASENGRTNADFLTGGGVGGREQLDFLTEERIQKTARSARDLLHAASPPTGEMAVILDPSTTGTFAHESFGHGTEADQFLRERSYLKPLLGQTLGPSFLTIADDGAHPGWWGTIFTDDEGNPCRRTLLIDHGRFVGALHDRETAAAFHTSATGNTRRADVLSRAFVRMTNTFVEPGDWTLEELVREVPEGVLLENASSGVEDPQGGQMQLKTKRGRRIEHGELRELVGSMALSGRVLDFLRAIRGISKASDFELGVGSCGKGHTDILPAGTGGTYLLSRAVVGPG